MQIKIPHYQLNWQKLAKILFILIIIYFILGFSICLFKYFTFKYNALDLAIFNQVFYNSSLGDFFQFTIHPTSYLGDHFTPILFFLVPFYAVFKSPLFLLFWQTLLLALAAIPLFLIAKRYLTPWQTLLVIILYLFNPVTLNVNLFEFHLLAMVPFFILWTFYFYDQDKFRPFIILSGLSLFIREDVAFIIFMFGIIALIDKKKSKWIYTPIFLSALYFLSALRIVAYFSSAETYKFLVYYQWLGTSLPEIFINFFLKFHLVLLHIFTIPNLELVLGFLLIFLFIPLYRPKYLLLAMGMFMQIILGFASGELILRTHYGVIFLTACLIALIFSVKDLCQNQKYLKINSAYSGLIPLIIIAAIIYNFLVLGPAISFIKNIATTDYQEVKLKNQFVKQIPGQASLVTTYDLIPNLSSRKEIYSMNYLYLGKQQYAAGDYIIPDNTQFLLINFNDFTTYEIQYAAKAAKYYFQGHENFRQLLTDKNYQLKKARKNLALWQKDIEPAQVPLYQVLEELPDINQPRETELNQEITFLGYNHDQQNDILSLYFKPLKQMGKNYFLKFDNNVLALGYGLYPTSAWQADQIIGINLFDYDLPEEMAIIYFAGGLELDGLGTAQEIFDQTQIIGQLDLN